MTQRNLHHHLPKIWKKNRTTTAHGSPFAANEHNGHNHPLLPPTPSLEGPSSPGNIPRKHGLNFRVQCFVTEEEVAKDIASNDPSGRNGTFQYATAVITCFYPGAYGSQIPLCIPSTSPPSTIFSPISGKHTANVRLHGLSGWIYIEYLAV